MWQEEEEGEESYAQAALSPSSFYSLVPVEWSAHSLPRPLFMHYLPALLHGKPDKQVLASDRLNKM